MCVQASGEAIYTLDQPQSKEGLWACYVASDHPLARFDAVDASQAMKLPGVVAYIGAKDIPKGGVNSALGQEPVFAEELVEWVGQPIGLLVAETRAAAERGAQLVKVWPNRAVLTLFVQCVKHVWQVNSNSARLACMAAGSRH